MNSSSNPSEPAITGSGGLATNPVRNREPLEALDDLMAAIENLCPVWPSRSTFANITQLRL